MNNADRDKFYGFEEDDDVEYEVEPPDADVIAAEKRRAQEDMALSELSIDVDEIYRARSGHRDLTFDPKSIGKFHFQFRVTHMLVATAVLAVLLTLWRLEILWTVAGLLIISAFGGALAFMEFREQRQWVEAQRRFEEKYARRRRYLESRNRPPQRAIGESTVYDDVPFRGDISETSAENERAADRRPFRFQFSLWQLFLAMTAAAIVLGMMTLLGGPANTATLLGFIAFGGLLAHAVGADPPEVVILGWWMLLALYVILSLAAILFGAF
jgi:hypothetical protein